MCTELTLFNTLIDFEILAFFCFHNMSSLRSLEKKKCVKNMSLKTIFSELLFSHTQLHLHKQHFSVLFPYFIFCGFLQWSFFIYHSKHGRYRFFVLWLLTVFFLIFKVIKQGIQNPLLITLLTLKYQEKKILILNLA